MPAQKFNAPLAINPGDLCHRIAIQKPSSSQNPETGEPSLDFDTVVECSAAIRTPTSREMYQTGQGGQFVSQVTKMVTIRWPGAGITITAGMRVKFGAKFFTIQTVEDVLERNRLVNLLCVEINGGGAGCS